VIAHWDEVEGEHADNGVIGMTAYDLGEAAGTRGVGVTRARVEPGRQSSPVHVEVAEEEIFFVLGGSGLSWQDEHVYEVRPGDCIVHRVGEETHTMIGGVDGLDVFAFGERADPTLTYLPRARVARMGVTLDVSPGPHPWEREAAAGVLDLPAPSPRRENIVNVDEVERDYDGDAGRWITLARKAGAVRTGLNWGTLTAGRAGAPPHCHSADEEIFVILEGSGTLELWPSPARGGEREEHEIRAGHVISRPAGTGIAHYFRAGDGGMTFLAYGTREPNDICYYPRSNKIFWRGVGLIARLEHVAYFDGEPED
jgi:uncharacterized cupin superfamily protein